MPNNELQDLLGARFENFTHASDESVWSAIEAQLDESKSDKIGIWFWIFNGIACTLLVSLMLQSVLFEEAKIASLSNQMITEQLNEPSQNRQANEGLEDQSSSQSSKSHQTKASLSKIDVSAQNERTVTNTGFPMMSNSIDVDADLTEANYILPKQTTSDTPINVGKQPKRATFANNTFPILEPNTLERSAPEIQTSVSWNSPNRSHCFKNMPIHIGFEATRMKRTSFDGTMPDTTINWAFEELNRLRDFEVGGFLQVSLTRRFSVSAGLGYSRSEFEIETPITNAPSIEAIRARQKIWSIPVVSKFNLINKGRFHMNAGIVMQGEFGKMDYSQKEAPSWASVSSSEGAFQDFSFTETHSFRQFSIEPFAQFSVDLFPRIAVFSNIGYRSILLTSKQSDFQITKDRKSFVNIDVGLSFRIH